MPAEQVCIMEPIKLDLRTNLVANEPYRDCTLLDINFDGFRVRPLFLGVGMESYIYFVV